MNRAQALAALEKINVEWADDEESAHIAADEVLCDLLTALGYADVVVAYKPIPKWYA